MPPQRNIDALTRLMRISTVSLFAAAACAILHVAGAILVLIVGMLTLVFSRKEQNDRQAARQNFAWWILCVLTFAGAVIAWAALPLASDAFLPAANIASVILSPLFGTFVYAIERSWDKMRLDRSVRS